MLIAISLDGNRFRNRARRRSMTVPRTVSVETTILAPRGAVWSVLVDFARYPEWNPFTVRVETGGKVGDTVSMDVMLGGRRMQLREQMRLYEPEQRFGWGLYVARGILLDCTRVQELEELDRARTLYRCHEAFHGLLVPLFFRRYEERMKHGFTAVAQALKRRVEQDTKITRARS
jgi:hypothetical protein